MTKSKESNADPVPAPPSTDPPALKQEWPMYLGFSEALDFLKIECLLRENEARRRLEGAHPKIPLAKDTGIGFKRWHRKSMLDFRSRLFENAVEGSDEG